MIFNDLSNVNELFYEEKLDELYDAFWQWYKNDTTTRKVSDGARSSGYPHSFTERVAFIAFKAGIKFQAKRDHP